MVRLVLLVSNINLLKRIVQLFTTLFFLDD
jgi:hypothetical protein